MNGDRAVIFETEEPIKSVSLDVSTSSEVDSDERTEPDLDFYADTLERHEVEALEDVETGALIDLYTLLDIMSEFESEGKT